MPRLLPLCAAVFFATGLWAQSAASPAANTAPWTPPAALLTLLLWPAPPNAKAGLGPEVDLNADQSKTMGGRPYIRLTNVSAPTITVYPPKTKSNGAAVVVFPGGGYKLLSIDLEGTEVCEWLNQAGVTCVLLKYRVPDSGPYPKYAAALEDAQRAMGIVRLHAAEWGIDPHRVGVLGFSAGGHLAAALGSHFDKRIYTPIDAADQQSCRPDFAVLLYPAYLTLPEKNFVPSPDVQPPAGAPPTFLLQAENDPVHVENAVQYFLALKNAQVPAELHIYAEGGHGYGLRPREFPIMGWPKLVETWLRTAKIVPAS
jgi:acetyl esterase/lipase